MYTIAAEAYKDRQYDAAVEFSKTLVKMMKEYRKGENPAYLQDFNLTYERAKQLHRKYTTLRDRLLAKLGHCGSKVLCRSETFKSKMKSLLSLLQCPPFEILRV